MKPIPRSIAVVLQRERQRLRDAGEVDIPKLPCCTFWGKVLTVHFDQEDDPRFAEVPGSPVGSSNHARLNSWPEAIAHTGDRWCAVAAVEERGGAEVDDLVPLHWHIGQCWSKVGGIWRGDMYGVLVDLGAEMVYVSDTANGFRAIPCTEQEWLEHLRRSVFNAERIERRLLVV